jgi:hypothetical protein
MNKTKATLTALLVALVISGAASARDCDVDRDGRKDATCGGL